MHLTHPLVLVKKSPVQESEADSGAEGEVREEWGTWPKGSKLRKYTYRRCFGRSKLVFTQVQQFLAEDGGRVFI